MPASANHCSVKKGSITELDLSPYGTLFLIFSIFTRWPLSFSFCTNNFLASKRSKPKNSFIPFLFIEPFFSKIFIILRLFLFPAFYKIKSKTKDLFLLVPFIFSLFSVFVYRYMFIDLSMNPGGIFIPTDLYGLADLNTFLVGFLSSTFITLAYNKFSK